MSSGENVGSCTRYSFTLSLTARTSSAYTHTSNADTHMSNARTHTSNARTHTSKHALTRPMHAPTIRAFQNSFLGSYLGSCLLIESLNMKLNACVGKYRTQLATLPLHRVQKLSEQPGSIRSQAHYGPAWSGCTVQMHGKATSQAAIDDCACDCLAT